LLVVCMYNYQYQKRKKKEKSSYTFANTKHVCVGGTVWLKPEPINTSR
jgi:hypothetical protein